MRCKKQFLWHQFWVFPSSIWQDGRCLQSERMPNNLLRRRLISIKAQCASTEKNIVKAGFRPQNNLRVQIREEQFNLIHCYKGSIQEQRKWHDWGVLSTNWSGDDLGSAAEGIKQVWEEVWDWDWSFYCVLFVFGLSEKKETQRLQLSWRKRLNLLMYKLVIISKWDQW